MKKELTVLIADDRSASRKGIIALLATETEITIAGEAADGRQALQLVAEIQPDVVLMDVRMPVMDGLEATLTIKEHWPRVRVIILTLYQTYQAQALAAGADDFLIKGCTADELVAAIVKD
jgi:YesN/AraC family two-component response regulator